ncbi:MAG: CDP-alcohol phosphatidyltransferase family protein [Candidatus Thermoplasmatota archaeon]|nr:CDP-alcohol phosphatidyltransferase family protein [Candidatus Thermoplasmatota archaeon]MBU1940544.1 CDP-alcohol phosphatidyltransferase family protein [Candidatus Thermoplasmatota archaeon]
MPPSMIRFVTTADLLSLLNACFGFLAILAIFFDEQRFSFSFIFLALLADGLDGIVARKYGAGKMGEHLEAMADMLSLSVAPAAYVFIFGIIQTGYDTVFFVTALMVLLLFLVASGIRLAAFHVLKETKYFIGLPASVSTIILVGLATLGIPAVILLLIMVVVTVLMISPVRFLKLTIWITTIAAVLIIGSLLFYRSYSAISIVALLLAIILYAIGSPIYVIRMKRMQKLSS